MPAKKQRKLPQTAFQALIAHPGLQKQGKKFLIDLRQPVAVKEKLKSPCLLPDHFGDHIPGFLPVFRLYPLQTDGNDRVLPHIFFTQFFFSCNLKTIEQLPVASDLKKRTQHTHIQRLSKPPWPGKEVRFSPIFHQYPDQAGLIHIIIAVPADFLKLFNSHRQFFPYSHFRHRPFPILFSPIIPCAHERKRRRRRHFLHKPRIALCAIIISSGGGNNKEGSGALEYPGTVQKQRLASRNRAKKCKKASATVPDEIFSVLTVLFGA